MATPETAVHTQYRYKIAILGDPNVGKRSYLMRVINDKFGDPLPTDMDGNYQYSMEIDNDEILVQLCLNPSFGSNSDRFARHADWLYRNTNAFILMYSVEDRFSFENLREWGEEIDSFGNGSEDVTIAVIGSKCDLPVEIDPEMIEEMCIILDTKLNFFVSAKTGEGVKESLDKIVKTVHERKTKKSQTAEHTENYKLTPEVEPKRSKCSS